MANRFDRLFQLPPNQYIEGSPVVLAAGALLKDNETGSIIAQLKFQSVSEKRIKAIKVSLSSFDISKTEVQGVSDYQYLEMNISNGQEFGANKAIVMPISVTRSFTVSSVVVVFHDGSMWENNSQFAALPTAKSLAFVLGNAEIEKQYRIATNESAICSPTEDRSLWQCSCGRWNSGANCTCCRIAKNKVFSALDISTLTEQMNIRLANEKVQREEEAARLAKQQAEAEARQKKNKQRFLILTIVLLIVLVLSMIGTAIYNKVTELTIEKLLALYTHEDVISLLGEPKETKYNSYDVDFMGEDFYLAFHYDENAVNSFDLIYHYPGTEEIETVGEIFDYTITISDRQAAGEILEKVMASFTEKFGKPKVFNSQINTTTYTWIVNDRMIELYDYTSNDDMGQLFGAFEIDVNCDHQSFCEHADTRFEHQDATCTENGYDRKVCNICGYIDETVKKAFGHKLNASITEEPSCIAEGVKTHQCTVCGYTKTEAIATLPHTNQSVVTQEPTCTEEGIKTYTCSECGKTSEEKIDKIAHNYKDTITKQATCSAEGIKTSTCTECGASTETKISKIPHSYVETVTKQPTCTATGTKAQKCSVCGYTASSVSIPALGHDYGQYAIDDATCTTNGTRYMKCTNCGDEYTTVIEAFGHSWLDATCTNAKYCQNCGATNGEPLGHNWIVDSYPPMGVPFCKRCKQEYIFTTQITTNMPCVLTTSDGVVVTISDVWFEFKVKSSYWDEKFDETGGCRLTIHISGTATSSFMIETYAKLYSSDGTEIDDILSSHGFTYPDSDGNFTQWFSYDIPDIADSYEFIAKVYKQTEYNPLVVSTSHNDLDIAVYKYGIQTNIVETQYCWESFRQAGHMNFLPMQNAQNKHKKFAYSWDG